MSSAVEHTLPKGWVEKKLKDKEVCELIMGQSPSSDTYNTEGKGMPFFQGKKEFGDISPVVEKYCTSPKKIAFPGDILMSVRAPVGPTNIANIECCIGRGLAAIRPNLDFTLKNYLLYYFKNFEVEISKKGKGSTFTAITKNALEESVIPLPPLEEQKRIVAKIDGLFAKIDNAISLTEESLKQAENLFTSSLSQIFDDLNQSYNSYPLTKYVDFVGGSQPPKSSFSYELKEGFIRLIQIRDYKTDNHIVYINKDSTKKFCEADDVMIGRYGPPVFQILRGIKGAYNVALMKAIPNESMVSKDFLFYFLQNSSIQNYIISISQRSAGQSGVNKKALEAYSIVLPPLDIQSKCVDIFNQLQKSSEETQSKLQEQLAYLKQLKSSILSKAFKGEL